ncbi:MAG: hypothetical protein PVJ39_18530 [Gammaproteobacteria bacterium]|jgi:hypothetical protein
MKKRMRLLSVLLFNFTLLSCSTPPKEPTSLSIRDLAQRSSIVVSGKVIKTNASEEPLLKASRNTVVVKVSRMYAGAEITGDQNGRKMTAILSGPGRFRVGTEAVFFGNPRFAGKTLTMIDEGEMLAEKAAADAGLQLGLQTRRDKPVLDRLDAASVVFLGKVENEKPLESDTDKKDQPRESYSEHDPKWHVAAVRVLMPLRGADKDALVMVIFPSSRDIMWFNSPKLKAGQEGIFIAHRPAKEQEQLMRVTGVTAFIKKQPAVLVTQPFDVLPPSDESRVRKLLGKEVQ